MMSDDVGKTKTKIGHRAFSGDRGFWRIRKILIDTYPLTPLGFNWEVRSRDGVMYTNRTLGIPEANKKKIQLWEGPIGELLGFTEKEIGRYWEKKH